MRIFTLAPALLASSLAFAQLDSNSVTVTASRNIAAPADQLTFYAYVSSGITSTLDDIVAALQGSGITATDFQGLNNNGVILNVTPIVAPALQWQFAFTAPLAKMKDTVAALTALQQSIPKKTPGLAFSFSVGGLVPSSQQTSTCPVPDLVADARAQSQKLANASGLTAGTILAISGITSTTTFAQPPSPGPSGVPFTPFSQAGLNTFCSLTVKFSLTR